MVAMCEPPCQASRLEAHLRRIDAQTARWQFGPPKPNHPRTAAGLPVIERVALGDGRIHIDDAVTALKLEAPAQLAVSAGGNDAMQIDASGPVSRHAVLQALAPNADAGRAFVDPK